MSEKFFNISPSGELSLRDDLTSKELSELKSTTKLNFGGKDITSIKQSTFDNLPELQSLSLATNQLSSLPADIFKNLQNLTELFLSNNQLSSLPVDIFKNLTNLKRLNLPDNKLTELGQGTFDNLPNLKQLYLSDNKLTELPQGTFDKLSELEELDLTNNQLTEIHQDTFNKLSALQWLSLSNNQLSSLPVDIFKNLTNLKYLNLSNNKFTEIRQDIFNKLPNLQQIELSNNPTTTLEITLLNSNIYTSEFVDKKLIQTLKANIQIEKFNRYSNLKTFIYTGSDNIKIPPEIEANLDTIITPNKVKLDLTKKPSSFLISGIEDYLADKLKPEIERLKKEYKKITDFNFENLEGRSIEELTEITLFVDALRHEEKAIIGFFFESAFQEHERTVKTEKDEFWNNYYTGSINDVDKKADAFIIINIGRSLQNIGRSLQTSKQNQNNALVDNPETTDATAADKETKAPINLNSNQVATPNQQNDGVKCSFEGMTFDEVISPVKDSETTQTPETPKKEVGKTVPSTAASL